MHTPYLLEVLLREACAFTRSSRVYYTLVATVSSKMSYLFMIVSGPTRTIKMRMANKSHCVFVELLYNIWVCECVIQTRAKSNNRLRRDDKLADGDYLSGM